MFFDLGKTLVYRNNQNEQFVKFSDTDSILSKLKQKGIKMGIISDGSRTDLDNLLADPSLLNAFQLVVMSEDSDVGGVEKAKKKIFNVAIDKMGHKLGFGLKPKETAFLTENVEHFKVYNFLYTLGLKNIIGNNCIEYT